VAIHTDKDIPGGFVSDQRNDVHEHERGRAGWLSALGWVLLAVLVWTGCDAAGPPLPVDETGEAPALTGEAVSVRLLDRMKGGAAAQKTSDVRHRCIANVTAPETEAGYRTYELALSFADSLDTTGDATTTLAFDLHVTPPAEDALGAYAEADSSHASRVRCWIPQTEAAAEHLGARIRADVDSVFGDDGYRLLPGAPTPWRPRTPRRRRNFPRTTRSSVARRS